MNIQMKRINAWLRIGTYLGMLFVLSFSFWTAVSAQTDNYTLLAPIPGTTIEQNCTGTECHTNFETYLPGVLKWSIGIAAIMAFFVITFGGITLMTTDSVFGHENGKKMIENALWGLLLVIGAYTILYTINPKILSFDLNINRIEVKADAPSATSGNPNTNAVVPSDVWQSRNDSARLLLLNKYHVTVNHSNACPQQFTPRVIQTGCTTVYGLLPQVINGLEAIQQNCNCTVTITGGTEYHGEVPPGKPGTHGPNNPVVDLANNAGIRDYIRKHANGELVPDVPTNNLRRETSIATFTYEVGGTGVATGDHWHVVFK
jgi:hypothetical protein